MKTIGFAGTAKNTGKTTAALQLLEQAHAAGYRTALTSIGYDGEALDNVTGLPKPRYFARRGALVATAEGCLSSGDARCKVVQRTEVETALGEVVIAEVEQPGRVVLAGPNKGIELEQVLSLLATAGADLTIADGALNRLVPLLCTSGLVFSTGAAFEPDIPKLAGHLAALCKLFEPTLSAHAAPIQAGAARITLEFADRTTRDLAHGSLIAAGTLGQLLDAVDRPLSRLTIPGACLPALLRELLHRRAGLLSGVELVFSSPLHLIAGAGPLEWQAVFEDTACRPAYLRTLPLLFITVNPFYPRYRQRTGGYTAAYVDKTELLSACRAQITHPPVLDVRQPPLPDLLALAWGAGAGCKSNKEMRHEP